jgi:hypothetical protein
VRHLRWAWWWWKFRYSRRWAKGVPIDDALLLWVYSARGHLNTDTGQACAAMWRRLTPDQRERANALGSNP